MVSVKVLLFTRTDEGWRFKPVRSTPKGKLIWDRGDGGMYYIEWYENRTRRRQSVGTEPAQVLEARRRKILELTGKAAEGGREIQPLKASTGF